MKKLIFFVGLSLVISSCALVFSVATYKKNRSEEQQFRSKLLTLIRQCVEYNSSLADKDDVLNLIDQIEKKDFVLEQGSDDLRIKYVFSQGCIEHVLACSQALGEVVNLIGMIHTPTPTTPLCTLPEAFDDTLLDRSIRFDLDKLLTVRSRAKILREYLVKGGVLYVVYPEGGYEKRTSQQQAIYQQELANHPHTLVNWVLDTNHIHPDMIGATYFFKNKHHEVYVFSIKARQANDPQDLSEWGLWLGKVKSPIIKQRVETLFDYFKTCGGPSKKNFFL